jgi:PAS domain S-box-containing protein
MSARVGRTLWVAVTIGVAFLIANLVLSLVNTRLLREESISILRSNELLLALDNVLKLVVDAETGQRGFVITGQAEYLTPYKTAVASIQAQMDLLQALTAGDPAQQPLMAEVRRHIGTKLGELDLTIALRERKGFDLTREVIALGTGKAEMDTLRATVAAMAGHETQLLLEREAAARKTYRSALVTEVVSGSAAIVALLGFSWLLARYLAARDRAEALITAQREQLKTTLASIGDAVITTDPDSKVTDLNRVAETLTGWGRADATGQPLGRIFRIVNEATRLPVEIPTERALREGVVVGLANHTILIRKDGSEAPIDDSAAPIRDAAGQLLGCILVFRDITGRKASERAVAGARTALERIVTEMAIPTMVYAEDGEVLIVNRAWTGISGYAAKELATLTDWMTRAYGQRAPMMSHVVRSLFELDHSVDNGEREITTATGEKRVWHFITAPLGRDDRGRRMLVTNAVDVTDRGRLGRLLAESEARLRLAMEAANYGSWQYEAQGSATVWSAKTRELIGVGPDEPITPELLRERVHPDDQAGRKLAIAQALTTGVYSHDFRVVHGDGQVRWLSSRGRVVADPQLGVRLLGLIGDITEQRQTVDALKDADRRKDEFLATLAHELRNPLAPLRNSLAVVQRSPSGSAAFAKASAVMERQLGHLVRLIDDLLDVGRISLDKLTLRPELADLGAIVEDAVEACRPAAERAHHVLAVSLPDAPIRLRADRARLTQVFSNLIGNACKFTSDGGHVSITVRREGDVARVEVRDDGIGIAAGDLERVFTMFAQADAPLERRRDGLGIGLALARRLAELHGGSIVVASDGPGRGSTFTVSVPIDTDAGAGLTRD